MGADCEPRRASVTPLHPSDGRSRIFYGFGSSVEFRLTPPVASSPYGRLSRRVGHRHLRRLDARIDLGVGTGVTVTQGILLAVAILMMVYLGLALFKPDWF